MRRIGKMSSGGPKAVEVGEAIREGAYAFSKTAIQNHRYHNRCSFRLLTVRWALTLQSRSWWCSCLLAAGYTQWTTPPRQTSELLQQKKRR
jgi:hypothetical protein